MSYFQNLDLLSVGLTVAAIIVLGFSVFFSNKKSITNQAFLAFSLITALWGIANYISYRISSADFILFSLRLVIFFAVWHAFSFFLLFYVFPKESLSLPKWFKFGILPLTIIASLINLSPLSFSKIIDLAQSGQVSTVAKGPGMLLFAGLVIFFIIGGLIILIRKMRKAQGIERTQFKAILRGTLITFSLLFIFNFFLPAAFNDVRFIPFGAIFILPFIAFTSYAIIKHHLLHIKVVATEILTVILSVVTLFEVVIAEELTVIIFRSLVFVLILIFGVLLIRSVIKEVEQREKLQELTEKLSATNIKLKELDELKSQFLSFASHQVKSPMAVVKGFAQIIRDGSYGEVPEKVKETAEKIYASADKLIDLVNNLLDMRKVEEGKMNYNFEEVDLIKLTKEIVEEFRLLAQKKQLDLSIEVKLDTAKAKVDLQKFKQVILNFIDNSIKYTPSGWVKIGVSNDSARPGNILIAVSDSGLGISKELLPKLFQQFSRDKEVGKKILGTGLGLFIAKQIVKDHGGEIWAESEGEGKGSQFYISIKSL